MKAYQVNIFATTETKATNELSFVTKANSKKEAREEAIQVINESRDKYESVKLKSIVAL